MKCDWRVKEITNWNKDANIEVWFYRAQEREREKEVSKPEGVEWKVIEYCKKL